MKRVFIWYVLIFGCTDLQTALAAEQQKSSDFATLYKTLESKIQEKFDQAKKSSDLPGSLLLLSIIADDAVQKGLKAPDYNLCDLGTICHGNKGITRINMPQLSGKPVPGSKADALPKDKNGEVDAKEYFGKYLVDSKKYKVTEENVRVTALKATQNELIGSKVAGIFLALQDPNSDVSKDIKDSYIYISSDNYVLDGHHRWAALVADANRKGNLDKATMKVKRIGAPILTLVDVANKWAIDFGVQAQAGLALSQPAAQPTQTATISPGTFK